MEPRKRDVFHYQTDDGRDTFQEWLDALKDIVGRAAVLKRIDRVEEGLFGDHRYVGDGIWELRIHYGPGYRIYYGEASPANVLLLLGGDKSSQKRDISKARGYWADYIGA